MERVKRKLVLENGDVYVGYGFGASSDAIGEIVFNTSMAAAIRRSSPTRATPIRSS